MKRDDRDYGLDMLRLLCMFMLATYHFLNYYGGQYVAGKNALIVQNFLWGGGRMICNVFLYISAWFLCEKKFKIERILKAWATVFVYSIISGVIFYVRTGNASYLIEHIFPISSNVVWYASMYIGILTLSPLLNILLEKGNRRLTTKVVLVFFVGVCVIPSFCPKFSYFCYGVLSWYILAYLSVGLMKLENFWIEKKMSFFMFVVGWITCLWFYNSFGWLMGNKYIATIFGWCGMYSNIYFANLASLPCCLAALGLFFFFLQIHVPYKNRHGGVLLGCIGTASMDVYIIASLAGPNGKLAWVELWDANYMSGNIFQCYALIFLSVVLGLLLGNIRERAWRYMVHRKGFYYAFDKIDNIISR